jgi:xylan 1,4-beta-xylosidase
MIENPILKGFNPDPSMIRVGEDYYIATSTFEWFPGVQIHHSRDLVNWRLLTHPLTRTSQLDLRGKPSSGGIWAPNLTYDNGTFYLIYTDVVNRTGVYKDTHNYLVTSDDIMGPWSEPIYLNSSGFDPAMFHDSDGRKWVINMCWNFTRNELSQHFDGILLQEYCPTKEALIGPIKKIVEGVNWVLEGSNLYTRGDYYYILLAERGTGYEHTATMIRSKNIEGPYEQDPNNPILTSRFDPKHPLQKAGHGSLVETQNGDWYMAYLCARPLPNRKLCPLGRETAIQKCEWTDDGWVRLVGNGYLPELTTEAPNLPSYPFESPPEKDDFNSDQLSIHFQTLRIPASEEWVSLKEREGFLRIYGRESLTSLHNQSLVARRIQDYQCEIETCVEFNPGSFTQMAGLICIYDENDHFYFRVSHDDKYKKHIGIITMNNGKFMEFPGKITIEGLERCYLKVSINMEDLQFSYSTDGEAWEKFGPVLDFGQLSDEYEGKLGFTGALVGMCVQDLSGMKKYADFDFFTYRSLTNNR